MSQFTQKFWRAGAKSRGGGLSPLAHSYSATTSSAENYTVLYVHSFYRNWVFDTVRFSSTSSISLCKPRVRPMLLSPVKLSSFLFYLHRANAKLFYIRQPITSLNSLHRPVLIWDSAQWSFGVSPVTWRIAVLVLANAHRTRCTLPAALFYVHCNTSNNFPIFVME